MLATIFLINKFEFVLKPTINNSYFFFPEPFFSPFMAVKLAEIWVKVLFKALLYSFEDCFDLLGLEELVDGQSV